VGPGPGQAHTEDLLPTGRRSRSTPRPTSNASRTCSPSTTRARSALPRVRPNEERLVGRPELGGTRLTRGGFKSLEEAQRALAEALRKKKSNARFQAKVPPSASTPTTGSPDCERTVNPPRSSQVRAQKPEIITWTGPQLSRVPDVEPRRARRRVVSRCGAPSHTPWVAYDVIEPACRDRERRGRCVDCSAGTPDAAAGLFGLALSSPSSRDGSVRDGDGGRVEFEDPAAGDFEAIALGAGRTVAQPDGGRRSSSTTPVRHVTSTSPSAGDRVGDADGTSVVAEDAGKRHRARSREIAPRSVLWALSTLRVTASMSMTQALSTFAVMRRRFPRRAGGC
jgi:hypothetical protein